MRGTKELNIDSEKGAAQLTLEALPKMARGGAEEALPAISLVVLMSLQDCKHRL